MEAAPISAMEPAAHEPQSDCVVLPALPVKVPELHPVQATVDVAEY